MKNAVCLFVDRLHAGHLGCYGAGWADTPAFNQLAAESFLLDSMLINSARLEHFYDSVLTGAHPLFQSDATTFVNDFFAQLKEKGIRSTFLTDDETVSHLPFAAGFNEVDCLPSQPAITAAADNFEDTRFAQLFARAIERLSSSNTPFFLVIHAGCLNTAWDAPREYRLHRLEEGDPEPPDFVLPPKIPFSREIDPDKLLGVSQAYSAETCVLDECLGGLLELLNASAHKDETLLLLSGVRGTFLGANARVGAWDEVLHGELLHVPCLLRSPDGKGALARSGALTQPTDLHAALREWWDLETSETDNLWRLVEGRSAKLRDCVLSVSDSEISVRTPAWFFRKLLHENPEEASRQLFAKPDDRWEVNDVANRCSEIVETMEAAAETTADWLKSGKTGAAPPLEPRLLDDASR